MQQSYQGIIYQVADNRVSKTKKEKSRSATGRRHFLYEERVRGLFPRPAVLRPYTRRELLIYVHELSDIIAGR